MRDNVALRRKLLKTIAASGGIVAAGKSLPETWSRPLIDTVILPAHAQTSPTEFSETQSSGNLCAGLTPPAGLGPQAPNPSPFVFNWPGLTPTGNGRLRVNAIGDITGNEGPNEEAWRIEFNGQFLGWVGNTNPAAAGSDTAAETFTIPQGDLIAAGGSATVTARNVPPEGGSIDCDAGIPNTEVTVRLEFRANIT